VTIGLVLAGGTVMARAADVSWAALALTVASAGLMLATRINPLLILTGAGLLGLLDVI
jgi:chromate transporter